MIHRLLHASSDHLSRPQTRDVVIGCRCRLCCRDFVIIDRGHCFVALVCPDVCQSVSVCVCVSHYVSK